MSNENAGVDEEVLGAEDEGVEAEDSLSSEESEDSTDWKAIAEAERIRADKRTAERDNYRIALDQKRQLRKGKPAVEEGDEAEERVGITPEELAVAIRETVGPMLAGSRVDALLAEKVKDPAKRVAVKLIYENRIRQTGTSDAAISEDIDAAIGIADQSKVRKMASEMERGGNSHTPPLNGPSNEPGPVRRSHGFTADQVKQLTAQAHTLGIDVNKFLEQTWKNSKRG